MELLDVVHQGSVSPPVLLVDVDQLPELVQHCVDCSGVCVHCSQVEDVFLVNSFRQEVLFVLRVLLEEFQHLLGLRADVSVAELVERGELVQIFLLQSCSFFNEETKNIANLRARALKNEKHVFFEGV